MKLAEVEAPTSDAGKLPLVLVGDVGWLPRLSRCASYALHVEHLEEDLPTRRLALVIISVDRRADEVRRWLLSTWRSILVLIDLPAVVPFERALVRELFAEVVVKHAGWLLVRLQQTLLVDPVESPGHVAGRLRIEREVL